MPAQVEEAVLGPDPVHAQHLGEHRAQQLLPARVAGPRPAAPRAVSGAGSARRSSFPFGVSGSASSTTTAAGTMYSGSRAAANARTAQPAAGPRRRPPSAVAAGTT